MPSHAAGSPRFLVVRLSSFGDVVLAEPVVRQLKAVHPGCDVAFATYEQYAAIPAMFAGVNRVLPVEHEGSCRIPTEEHQRSWDIAVDLQNNLRSRRVLGRVRARKVLRYRRQYLRRFVRVYAPWLWRGGLKHTVEIYLDALKPLGVKASAQAPELVVPSEALVAARDLVGRGALVGVCPGGSSPHKMWGRERFASLAGLVVGTGRRVVVVGAESDRGEVEAVAAGAKGGRILAVVENDPRVVAAVLSLCEVVVSNDSGLMHLAGGVGARVVSIFGPTSPDLGFAPLALGAVVSLEARCSPCSYHGNRPCRYPRAFCLEDIKPNEVLAVVERVSATGC
jgi:ADP-heptose:LPS heptosyltransferase